MLEELAADLLEVMLALLKVYGMEFASLQQAAEQKRAEKGGFDDKIIMLLLKLKWVTQALDISERGRASTLR